MNFLYLGYLGRRYMASKGPSQWNFKGLFPPELDAVAPGAGPDSNIVVVANSTLPANFEQIWKTSIFRVCADGGANKLYDTIPEPLKRNVIPHIIKGDFDSIRPEVKKYYANAGSQVVHDSNQDTTDLQKALSAVSLLSRRDERLQKALLVVVGGLGGNISQELSNFNCMFEVQDRRMCFAGDSNIVMVMHPGTHVIMSPPGIKCGIIPLGGPVEKVTTKGLKWNLNGDSLKFGGLVSSSNVAIEPLVEVTVSDPCMWTFDFNEYRKKTQNGDSNDR